MIRPWKDFQGLFGVSVYLDLTGFFTEAIKKFGELASIKIKSVIYPLGDNTSAAEGYELIYIRVLYPVY